MISFLDIKPQEHIKIYAHHALLASILLNNNDKSSWFNEHYVQLFSHIDIEGVFRIDYAEYFKDYREVLHIIEITPEKARQIKNITTFTINAISNNYFVILQVDEFFIQGKGAYNLFHYVRQILINGFDIDSQMFFGLGYTKFDDHSMGNSGYDKLTCEKLSFNTLQLAYYAGGTIFNASPNEYLLLIGEKKGMYNFNINRFINRLEAYITSRGHCEFQLASGFEIYSSLEQALQTMVHDHSIIVDSRSFYIINEHKQIFFRNCMFINNNFDLSLDSLLSEYQQKIVQRSKMLFYQYLRFEYKTSKIIHSDNNSNDAEYDSINQLNVLETHEVDRILQSIIKLKSIEFEIITLLFTELKKQLKHTKKGALYGT